MRFLRARRGSGCGLVLMVLIGLAVFAWQEIYPFLARQAPVESDILVIEGWMVDDVLLEAAGWAESNGVERIYTTGGPLELGSFLTEYKTYAEMTKARLVKLGLDKKFEIVAVPAQKVMRGRTRESARALKAALGMERGAINLASEGPHTRRSWRAFQDVLGDGVTVGSVALVPPEYGAQDWWKCSEGVRSVISETVAYGYDLLPRPADSGPRRDDFPGGGE